MKTKRKIKPGLKVLICILAFVIIIIGAFLIYTADYYHADELALEAASISETVDISQVDGALVFDPGDADTALIFYPGGKVEYTAYGPLLIKIAQRGILCVLPKMPFNLAVFDISAADTYINEYTQISHWYIGGHSLGGSMAASYASNNIDKIEGLVLLASYSTADLSKAGLEVISIYGDKDGVLNKQAYQDNISKLPDDFSELVIQGGNHAGFGSYGEQTGDGKAEISQEEQQSDTAEAIAVFCTEKND